MLALGDCQWVKVYNPAIYDPRFKEEFKDAGQIVSKD